MFIYLIMEQQTEEYEYSQIDYLFEEYAYVVNVIFFENKTFSLKISESGSQAYGNDILIKGSYIDDENQLRIMNGETINETDCINKVTINFKKVQNGLLDEYDKEDRQNNLTINDYHDEYHAILNFDISNDVRRQCDFYNDETHFMRRI